MGDRIIAPKVVHILITRTCEHVISYHTKDFAYVVRVSNLDKWRLTWITWESLNHKGTYE